MLTLISEASASVLEWIGDKLKEDRDYFVENTYECSESTAYVPFFLEVSDSPITRKSIELLYGENGSSHDPTFVPGGYVFRIQFQEGSLFALSGGLWERRWYSPEIDKSIVVSYDNVWCGRTEEGELYGAFITGLTPYLVAYSRDGEVKSKKEFDPSDEARMRASLEEHNGSERVLEKKLLLEYLRGVGEWRPVKIDDRLNFRNQQLDSGEAELINQNVPLTFEEAVQLTGELVTADDAAGYKPTRDAYTGNHYPLIQGGGAPESESGENPSSRPPQVGVGGTLMALLLALLLRRKLRK